MKKSLASNFESYETAMNQIPDQGLGCQVKVLSALIFLNVLEDIFRSPEEDPYPRILSTVQDQTNWLRQIIETLPLLENPSEGFELSNKTAVDSTISLFENAWTVYDPKTYEHSVELIRERLKLNGFDRNFFKDKICLDGGCGTARFSVAMAELGAKQVYALDRGEESLRYARKIKEDRDLKNIEIVNHDVTDLSLFESEKFDFVVSNGVLHHTSDPKRGILEHFRVTKSGGIFWLYLYGAGGVYWEIYDRLKDLLKNIPLKIVKAYLLSFDLQKGTIYTYLDNVLAPIREYFYTSDVEALLKTQGNFSLSNLVGNSVIDDTEKLLATDYGAEIVGPQGEVRVCIRKNDL